MNNPNRFAVFGVPVVKRFFGLAASRRVDIAIIADSNGRVGAAASGHEDAMSRAWGQRFPMYATRVEPSAPSGAYGTTTCSQWSLLASPFTNGGPAELVAIAFPDASFPGGQGFLPEGVQLSPGYNWGTVLAYDHPVGLESNLRFHLTHWGFGPASTGVLRISARVAWPGSIYSNYAASGPIPTSSSAPGPIDTTLDIPAGPRATTGLSIAPADAANSTSTIGPYAPLWQRIENLDRPTGIALSPLWEQGGRSARYTLETFQAHDFTLPMAEWLRQATRLQSGPPVLLVHIMHGGNDIGDYGPSLGPVGGLNSSTGPGHEDNIRGIIAALRGWWLQSGFDPANLFFQLGPYHPRPANETVRQIAFEQAWRDIAASDPQVFALAGTMLSTPEEFAQRGFLLNGVDAYHLSLDGFRAWASTMLLAIDRAICPADFDRDRALTLADVFAFLDAWFARDPTTDFNYSGTPTMQDIFDFLNAWFAGCP
ncbi:MAG TPA: GC-type dockerin domain-anchored protein [Phycisphaerales bacterium]|nr:GC-type dockerin domain-anchored protein [Phycisphaerales bacterium]